MIAPVWFLNGFACEHCSQTAGITVVFLQTIMKSMHSEVNYVSKMPSFIKIYTRNVKKCDSIRSMIPNFPIEISVSDVLTRCLRSDDTITLIYRPPFTPILIRS